jgi:vacuolar-type H+-ATPase subunit I/STV1
MMTKGIKMNWAKLITIIVILGAITALFGVVMNDFIALVDFGIFTEPIAFLRTYIQPLLDALDNGILTNSHSGTFFIYLMTLVIMFKVLDLFI